MKIIFALGLIVFIAVGCSSKPEVKMKESGLHFVDDTVGVGRTAQEGNLITINFRVWVMKDSADDFSNWTSDSSKMRQKIEDTWVENRPYKFVLGGNNFIKGSDEGIEGMKVGGMRTIIIPSKLAYGKAGMGPIPPNSSLKVNIQLIDVKDKITASMWDIDSTKMKKTKNGLKYIILQEGTGKMADSGDVVTVHYTGWLKDSTKFDSSVERDEPFSFTVGKHQVIPGWDEGIRFMNKGSKARFIIPPDLAYGSRPLAKIPPNSTLIFDVEMLDIK
jgi:FKBP-type peptidyl-prolyl cis-trans isomerase